jgi:hypothetical protein
MAKDSYTRPQKNTKAELHAMLAEAVRNTQPQPEPEPVHDVQPEPVRKARPANAICTEAHGQNQTSSPLGRKRRSQATALRA